MNSGIYKITTQSGRYYIGQTNNFQNATSSKGRTKGWTFKYNNQHKPGEVRSA